MGTCNRVDELTAVINTPEELLAVVITDEAGNVVYESSAAQLTANFFWIWKQEVITWRFRVLIMKENLV